jgi:small GTP-binding protein
MTPVTSKVCVVGDFAVGKTSVVERFVNNHFSEKYLSTVGVKIDTREVELGDLEVSHKLVIWDVAGADRFDEREFAYLRGASGFIFVSDGTRPQTLQSAENLRAQINERFGEAPAVVLVNKKDLTAEWSLGDDRLQSLQTSFDSVYTTSARTGEDVDDAIKRLSRLVINNDLRS